MVNHKPVAELGSKFILRFSAASLNNKGLSHQGDTVAHLLESLS